MDQLTFDSQPDTKISELEFQLKLQVNSRYRLHRNCMRLIRICVLVTDNMLG